MKDSCVKFALRQRRLPFSLLFFSAAFSSVVLLFCCSFALFGFVLFCFQETITTQPPIQTHIHIHNPHSHTHTHTHTRTHTLTYKLMMLNVVLTCVHNSNYFPSIAICPLRTQFESLLAVSGVTTPPSY